MKSLLTRLIIYPTLLFSLAACEQVDRDDRWTSTEDPLLPETERSTVLVEEYTGQKCINCPTAAAELKRIADTYPGNVITVALHAARTGQTTAALASAEADVCAKTYDIPGAVPGILVNRRTLAAEGRYLQKRALWNTYIRQAVNTPARYRIALTATPATNGKWRISATPTALRQQSDTPLGIQLWVVEDIRAEQYLPEGKQTDYFHHHVLRGALNGSDGATCHLGQAYEFTTSLPAEVEVITNAKVIAFLFDLRSKEVYEAAIVPLGSGIQPDKEEEPGDTTTGQVEPGDYLSFRTAQGETIVAGSEVKVYDIKAIDPNGREMEMVTPVFYATPGRKDNTKSYTLEITKEDHHGTTYGGLSQVCTDLCVDVENPEKYTLYPYQPATAESFVQVHYRIGKGQEEQQADYRVRLAVKEGEKVVTHFYISFCYDPEKRPTTPTTPTPEDPTPIQPQEPGTQQTAESVSNGKSNVVAMDFTGMRCPACPWTIERLARQSEELKPNLLVVAIQVWQYCRDHAYWAEEGDQYRSYRASLVRGYPTVLLNNIEVSGESYRMRQLIEQAPVLESRLTTRRTERNVEIDFRSQATAKGPSLAEKNLNVLFWVTENNVIGYQSQRSHDYVHNHLLRGSLNTLWGESYKLGAELRLQKKLPEKVKVPANCDLIAIVLDADSKEFIDAVKVAL